jgi:LytS/YehU family sensor histidine kinase
VSPLRWILTVGIGLWVAGALQQALAPALAIGGAEPGFLLILLATTGLFTHRAGGAFIGFLVGVVHGALSGANLASYALSRTVTGFFVGWFAGFEWEANVLVAFVSGLIATLLSQLILMFVAPPPNLGAFLLATIGAAVYNGVLAMPVFAILRRILAPSR